MKINGKGTLLAVLALPMVMLSPMAWSSCEEMMAEAEAIEGLVPKLNEDGTLKSLSMYGEATFLAAKRSLIGKARTKAQMRAKRSLTLWLEQSMANGTLTEDILEQVENTDSEGNTSGASEEITRQAEYMKEYSSAVLSGIVKLDECVDTEDKYVLVRMGWKPAMSAMAADVSSTVRDETRRADQESAVSGSGAAPAASKVKPAKGYRKKSSMADDF